MNKTVVRNTETQIYLVWKSFTFCVVISNYYMCAAHSFIIKTSRIFSILIHFKQNLNFAIGTFSKIRLSIELELPFRQVGPHPGYEPRLTSSLELYSPHFCGV